MVFRTMRRNLDLGLHIASSFRNNYLKIDQHTKWSSVLEISVGQLFPRSKRFLNVTFYLVPSLLYLSFDVFFLDL